MGTRCTLPCDERVSMSTSVVRSRRLSTSLGNATRRIVARERYLDRLRLRAEAVGMRLLDAHAYLVERGERVEERPRDVRGHALDKGARAGGHLAAHRGGDGRDVARGREIVQRHRATEVAVTGGVDEVLGALCTPLRRHALAAVAAQAADGDPAGERA